VDNVDDVVSVGQKIQVEITEVDPRGKLSLSPVVEGSPSIDGAGQAAADATASA